MCNKLKYFWVIALGVGWDQVAKYFALKNLEFGLAQSVVPHLNWHLNYNKGISFGLFNQASVSMILIGIIVMLIIGLLVWLWNMPKTASWQAVSLSLVIGGAIGNLIDRLYFGHVIDFIDFYIGNWHWYTFNVADSLICVGAVMLTLYAFRSDQMSP